MLAHTWLWMIVIVVFVPSFFAHCMLIIFTIRMRRSNKEYYKNLFYRLFVTQVSPMSGCYSRVRISGSCPFFYITDYYATLIGKITQNEETTTRFFKN